MNGPTVTRWWMIRHAPTQEKSGQINGSSDVPSIRPDDTQARTLLRRLPKNAQWLVTPLRRTQQTAEALADVARISLGNLHTEPSLAEQNYGEWEGKTWAELRAEPSDAVKTFWSAPARAVPPGGESFAQVIDRARTGFDALNQRFAGQDVIAVAHAGTVRAALAIALDIDPQRALGVVVDHLSLTRIDHIKSGAGAGVWRVVYVNLPPK